jgi:transposase InsO family protein
MPWKEMDAVSLRREFVELAGQEGSNIRELCDRFGISRNTGYKWLRRFRPDEPTFGLENRSRRPHQSPSRTSEQMEKRIVEIRKQHPVWGGRKIRARLRALGNDRLPSPSTITAILRRHGLLSLEEGLKHKAWTRFEQARPNDLWQMDFKGHFATNQGRCHPLTVLDDHSRFSLGIEACPNEQGQTVQSRLTEIFRSYGLPDRILADNGSPWGSAGGEGYTPLSVWLMRLGIQVAHGRPHHPQTQGKEERFHRTLKAEVIRFNQLRDLEDCQRRFAAWRQVYNWERPHEALGMEVPGSRYRMSRRSFPEVLPTIEYGPEDSVRRVQEGGWLSFKGTHGRVGKAFKGYPVALRPTSADGRYDVFFCQSRIAVFDLTGASVTHVPEHL